MQILKYIEKGQLILAIIAHNKLVEKALRVSSTPPKHVTLCVWLFSYILDISCYRIPGSVSHAQIIVVQRHQSPGV